MLRILKFVPLLKADISSSMQSPLILVEETTSATKEVVNIFGLASLEYFRNMPFLQKIVTQGLHHLAWHNRVMAPKRCNF